MQIKVDKDKISSLFSNIDNLIEEFYYEKIEGNIDNIIYELVNYVGNNYIITGYRGAGKTTFVKFLESKVSNKDNLFVFIDYPLSKGYYTLLKKIIRNLYISLESNNLINKNSKDKLKNEMMELYISTFSKVSKNSILSENNKKSSNKYLEIDIYSLLIYLISFISVVFGIIFIFIENNIVALLFIFIGILLNLISYFIKKIRLFSNFKRVIKKENNEENSISLNIKEYYDDDISEQHLKNIIKLFKEEGISITFVIDELDKIEKEDEVNEIINSIKPLLLSGISNFIIISGQLTLYQIYNGKIESDKVINSLFSREIHIPLFSKNYFQRVIKDIMVFDDNIKSNDKLLLDFINHLIVKSNKNIRKFLICFKNSISWTEENEAILFLNENKLYKNESKILGVIDNIETKYIQYHYIGIRDYFVNILFLWINSIYIKGEVEFKFEDIVYENNEHGFISKYNENIKLIGKEFFKSLVLKKILTKSKDLYKLNIEVESNPNNQNVHTVENIFFDLYRNLENIVIDLQNSKNRYESITKESLKFLKNNFKINLSDNIIELRNKIVHGGKTTQEDFVEIAKYVSDLPGIISNLLEEYTYLILKEYFKEKGFKDYINSKGNGNLDKHYDFKFGNNSTIINIDIKYNNFEISNYFDSINKQEFYIFIFYYDYKKYHGYDKIQNLNKVIKNKGLEGNVFLINNSESRWIINSGTTKAYIDKFFKEVVNNKNKKSSIIREKMILKTGYKNIDDVLSIYGKEVVLIGSHPFELSSNFALNIYLNNSLNGNKGLYISKNIVKERMLEKISNFLGDSNLTNDINELSEYFLERMLLNILDYKEIGSYINKNTEFIIIDNIQTYCTSTKDYNALSDYIKSISIKYNIPIIITSNLPLSKISARPDKRPSDLDMVNYSENLLNMSNVAITLYKEQYYDEFTEKKGIVEVNIHKGSNSNGNFSRGLIELWDKNGKYFEIERNKE